MMTRAQFLRMTLVGAAVGAMRGAGAQEQATEDLYVGHYIPLNFPDAATVRPGVLFARVPVMNGAFAGQLFFPFEGCRSHNVGTLEGQRVGTQLSGIWRESLDAEGASAQFLTDGQDLPSGALAGKMAALEPTAAGCVASNMPEGAEWMLLRTGALWSADEETSFVMTQRSNQISWPEIDKAAYTYAALIDPANIGRAEQGPILAWQRMGEAFSTANLSNQRLTRGRDYVLSVLVTDDQCDPLAQGCTRFTWR